MKCMKNDNKLKVVKTAQGYEAYYKEYVGTGKTELKAINDLLRTYHDELTFQRSVERDLEKVLVKIRTLAEFD